MNNHNDPRQSESSVTARVETQAIDQVIPTEITGQAREALTQKIKEEWKTMVQNRDSGTTVLTPIKTKNHIQPPYGFPAKKSISLPFEQYQVKFTGEEFDPEVKEHLARLDQTVDRFEAAYQKLQTCDYWTLTMGAVAAGAYLLGPLASNLPIVGSTLAWAVNPVRMGASSSFGALTVERRQAFQEYSEALKDLMNDLAWCTGFFDAQDDKQLIDDVVNNTTVHRIVMAASQVLTKQELRNIIADIIEEQLINTYTDYKQSRETYHQNLYGPNSNSYAEFLLGWGKRIGGNTKDWAEYATKLAENVPYVGRVAGSVHTTLFAPKEVSIDQGEQKSRTLRRRRGKQEKKDATEGKENVLKPDDDNNLKL